MVSPRSHREDLHMKRLATKSTTCVRDETFAAIERDILFGQFLVVEKEVDGGGDAGRRDGSLQQVALARALVILRRPHAGRERAAEQNFLSPSSRERCTCTKT